MRNIRKRSGTRLIVGLLGILLGLLLLLSTTGVIRTGTLLIPVILFMGGVALLIIGYSPEGRDGAVLPGVYLILLAMFLILRATILPELTMRRIWPVFLLMAGVALFVYSWNGSSDYRLVIGVPAITVVVLSIVFLLFSLEVITTSFIDFVYAWWPALLVFAGIIAIWSHFDR